jgi:hypothetical protein
MISAKIFHSNDLQLRSSEQMVYGANLGQNGLNGAFLLPEMRRAKEL